MGDKTAHQHYVPQMYLKRFCSDGAHFDVWNINNDVIMPHQRTRSFAGKRYFYDADNATLKAALSEMETYYGTSFSPFLDKEDQFVEKGLSRSEGEMSCILNQINRDHSCLYN